jgi:serine/threonine protein kinase/tetratricopeptide (TPR) repeat protein
LRCPKCRFENPQDTKFCGQCRTPLVHQDGPQVSSTETLLSPAVPELSPGTTFARRYQVIEELGRGGMGRVYKVFDTEVREKLALKLLNPEIAADEQTIERFRNELKLARTISHRNICRMHDLGREEGAYYITMEYVPGEDLKSFIHRVGALPIGKAVTVARQVCEGLAEAHRVGVVHRDLKPQNIMIDRDGNARIMDFGIARSVRAKGITGANMMIGTPEYMSPEQVDGKEADARSDIYSLGIVLFEMLTGRLPFEGDTPLAVAVKQKSEPAADPARINPQIPEDLSRAVLKCLEKSKDRRYQSVDELSADLAKVEKALPKTTQPLPIHKPATSKQITVRLPSKKVWIPAVVALAAVIAFVVWQLIPERAAAKRSLAIMGFKNQTGDPSFDYLQETIPNLLITSLEQSGHFRVTTWQQLKDLLRQVGKDASASLDEEAGFEVCRREGIEALVVGFYTKAGETFVTDVKVLDASTKQPLKTAQARGEGPASILKTQIDEISRAVSRGIGLPVLKIEKSQPKVADLTTNSLEAYNYFLRGRDELERFYFVDARKSLESAVALDPTFAAAHLYLARVANELSDPKSRDESIKKARQLVRKATEKERLYIEAWYAQWVERDLDKRYRMLAELAEKYPAEKYAHSELGLFYDNRSQYPEAIQEYEKALALDPNFGSALNGIAYAHAKLGDFDRAISYLEKYAALNPRDPNPLDSIAEIYTRMGRLDEAAAKYSALLAGQPGFYLSYSSLAYVYALQEDYGRANQALGGFIAHAPSLTARSEALWYQSYFRYFEGRWTESLSTYLALKREIEQSGSAQYSGPVDWITGFLQCDRGDFEAARKAFESFTARRLEQNPANKTLVNASQDFFSGWVALKQGRLASARAGLKEMESRLERMDPVSRDRMIFLSQLLEAEIALAEGSPERSIAAAEKMKPGMLPDSRTQPLANYNLPFLKDVLARAYWKKADLDKAAAEYRKLITIDPANQVRYLIHPLYHYRLGQVLEEKGEKEGARAQYAKFLECWKDADASHPELADARKRLATLRP